MSEEIKLQKAVLHILDNKMQIPVLSKHELDLSDDEIICFLEKHILKAVLDNDIKNAEFIDDNNPVSRSLQNISSDFNNFLEISCDMANALFAIMLKNIDIPAADLICCLFRYEDILHLGILKMNYKSGFIHYVQNTDQGSGNVIIKQRTLLPSETNKIEECVFVDLSDKSLKIIEKQFKINGVYMCYLSELFLNCKSDLSNNEKVRILDKATRKITRKHFDEEFKKTIIAKKVINESIENTNEVEINYLAEEVFPEDINIREEYIAEIQRAGIKDKSVSVPADMAGRRFGNQKIKTDTGIEINFPASFYTDKDKIEFLNNPDGTLSILIKNIGRITNK